MEHLVGVNALSHSKTGSVLGLLVHVQPAAHLAVDQQLHPFSPIKLMKVQTSLRAAQLLMFPSMQ